MINIVSIKNGIKDVVTELTCKKYNVSAEEVKVNFTSQGDININITPKTFIESLSASFEVSQEETK